MGGWTKLLKFVIPLQLQVSFFFLYQPCSVWLLLNKESFSQPLALWFWLLHDLALSLIKFCASLGSREQICKELLLLHLGFVKSSTLTFSSS